jgi:CBS domain containing-hemolysin-like protein
MFAHINICTFCWCMGNLCSMSLVFQYALVFVQVMQALPIFLDRMFNEWVAVILSVTFVLAFGEVMPQAICSRFGLAVGANMVWLVKILMWICFPVAYPVGLVISFHVDISHKGCLPSYEWRNSQRITFLQSSVLEHSRLTF